MVETIQNVTKGSWRTTLAGVFSALALAGPQLANWLDADPATVCDWTVVIGALAVGLGFSVARDDKVTSEQSGAAK